MIISAQNITKYYIGRNKEKIEVLNDISLEIKNGESVAIIGASGSGKSTFLNLLSGIDKPSTGHVFADSIDLSEMNGRELADFRNKKIAYILQNFGLIEDESVKVNILIPLKIRKINIKSSDIIEKLSYIADKLDIKDKINEKVYFLSGGQKQRVAIARAYVQDADIILADEPTGALPRKMSEEIFDLLIEMTKTYEKGLVVVTHDTELASKCEKVYSLVEGKLERVH